MKEERPNAEATSFNNETRMLSWREKRNEIKGVMMVMAILRVCSMNKGKEWLVIYPGTQDGG